MSHQDGKQAEDGPESGRTAAEDRGGRKVLTVTELTLRIKDILEKSVGSVWVSGEISNLRKPSSGHIYLTLKDAGSTLPAVIFKRAAAGMGFDLADGIEIVAFGEVSVYPPRGAYQIIIGHAEPKGIGTLQLAFEQLKKKLASEGLFDAARKKPLPFLPRRIGIVTSPSGAALQDMLNVILKRFPRPHVSIMPVRVQGEGAAREIAEAISDFNLKFDDVDVIIVGRGGGSLEDLWPFNEEVVARAIAASRIPVISAVGHEIDFTISDFVADRRALTPTEAGEIVVPEYEGLVEVLDGLQGRIAAALRSRAAAVRKHVEFLLERLAPERAARLAREAAQRTDDLSERLEALARRAASEGRKKSDSLEKVLESLNPARVLDRGFSFTTREGQGAALRDSAGLGPGELVRTRLARGSFVSRVEDGERA